MTILCVIYDINMSFAKLKARCGIYVKTKRKKRDVMNREEPTCSSDRRKMGIKGEDNSKLISIFDRQSDTIAAARQISRNQHS